MEEGGGERTLTTSVVCEAVDVVSMSLQSLKELALLHVINLLFQKLNVNIKPTCIEQSDLL